MNLWQNYVSPHSVQEALQALNSAPGPALPIAGGTDLLLDLQQGRHPPIHTLVDLNNIPEMNRIEERAGNLFIGAAVPLSRMARDGLVNQHAQALVEACNLVGGPQVRNVATLGGNVAHALPAADGTIALLALDAEAEIENTAGKRWMSFQDLFAGPGKTTLSQGQELLIGFHLPPLSINQASAFKRIMRPQGVALPILNIAIWLERKVTVIVNIRIAVGPGGLVPWRAREAEQILAGKPVSDETTGVALEALLQHVKFRSSPRRASADYRRHLIEKLFMDTLGTALIRVH